MIQRLKMKLRNSHHLQDVIGDIGDLRYLRLPARLVLADVLEQRPVFMRQLSQLRQCVLRDWIPGLNLRWFSSKLNKATLNLLKSFKVFHEPIFSFNFAN